MRKKLLLLTTALALAAGAAVSRPAAAIYCFTTCCESRPSLCITCCPALGCPDIACP